MNLVRTVALSLAIMSVSGCSSVNVYKANQNGKPKGDAIGVTYYQPAYYLQLTTSTTKGKEPAKTKQYSIVTLPDLTQPRTVVPKYGLGSLNWKLTLKDGWRLETINGDADPQLDEMLTALASVIPTLEGADAEEANRGAAAPEYPKLWRIIFDKHGTPTLKEVKVLDAYDYPLNTNYKEKAQEEALQKQARKLEEAKRLEEASRN